jgi:hypothetical protein
MKPTTMWIAVVLLGIGVCGMLDAAGAVDSAQTIGQWWPIAIVGWAIAEMFGVHRVTLGGVICSAIGIALLADAQAWAADTVVWSALAIALGVAILAAGLAHAGRRDGDAPTALGGGGS